MKTTCCFHVERNLETMLKTCSFSERWERALEQNLILQSIGVNKEEFDLVIVSGLVSWENDAYRFGC